MYTDNKHKLIKIILRIIGFSLIGLSIIGAILLIIFFSKIDFMLQPVFIFLTILPTVIAIPLIFLSFASNIGKYGAKESVEIQKQVMKDIIDDSKQFSKEIASSVKIRIILFVLAAIIKTRLMQNIVMNVANYLRKHAQIAIQKTIMMQSIVKIVVISCTN